ncbi:cell division protein FtsW [Candidatus Saccharibacteria bacterium]|nr:cell division protein FtsW [Candidatus Saccharibacteria bacterium]
MNHVGTKSGTHWLGQGADMFEQSGVGARRAATATTDALRRHRPDYWLVVIVAFLLAIGLTVVYSISPALTELRGGNYVEHQTVAIALSIVAFVVTSRIPLTQWRRWQWGLLGLAALGTMIALVTPPIPAYPQHRWIRLGSFSLQSVEILKFALLVGVSGFLASRARDKLVGNYRLTLKPIAVALGLVGFIVAFVQSDLVSAGVIVVMVTIMAFIAGLPMRRIMLIAAVVILGTIIAVSSTPYRRDRLNTYLHPEANCSTAAGHQACQALIAVGSGGMIGLGLGKSVQAYGYLPEAQNDSIFAIYAEKFGFIGSMVLLGLFVALFSRLRLIAERAPDTFSRLLVVGVLAWLSTQAIINIGAMIGLLPLKGITLPLISYGGTSVLFVGAALGLVFQVSYYTSFHARSGSAQSRKDRYEYSSDRRRVGRAHHTHTGRRV